MRHTAGECPSHSASLAVSPATTEHRNTHTVKTIGDGELGCLCGKAGTSHVCDGSAHSSGCMVNGSNCLLSITF